MRAFSCSPHLWFSPERSYEVMSSLRAILLIALAFLVGVGATVAARDLFAPPPAPQVEPIRLSPDRPDDREPRKKRPSNRRPQRERKPDRPAPDDGSDGGAPLAPPAPPARAGDDDADDDFGDDDADDGTDD